MPFPAGNLSSITFSSSQNNGNVTRQAIHHGAKGGYAAMDFQQISATESRANNTP